MTKIEYEDDCFGGKRIKYNEMYRKKIKHMTPLSNDEFNHILIIGGSGSGKSTLLLSIIPKFLNVSGIIIISLLEDHPIYDLIHEYCDDQKIDYKFNSDVQKGYEDIMFMIENKPENTHTIAIFDDIQSGKSMKNDSNSLENRVLNHCFSKLRNFNTSCILITQSYITIPSVVRSNANLLIYFKIKSKSGIEAFKRDLMNLTGYDNNICDEILSLCNDEAHSCIIASTDNIYAIIPSKMKNGKILQPLKINY